MRVRDQETRRPGDKEKFHSLLISLSPCLLVFALGLGLRLLVWRWHEQYPLSGDESEYFNQALTLLREHRYLELNLMRPPLYTGFLAACMYVFDSLIQRLRLIQAIISALTVLPIYLLTLRLFGARRVALLAALLAALSYTLADRASELLTETLFVCGLTTLLWLLLLAAERGSRRGDGETGRQGDTETGRRGAFLFAGLAGLNLGALVLLRSVALPLLPLGALWLILRTENREQRTKLSITRRSILCSLSFVLCSFLLIAPWTIRNYATYGALILVDTTGAENLWLDNNPAASTPTDPLGREAAKRQLYALGDDRAARQRLATANGIAAISAQPDWFAAKAWGQAKQFFALEYFDDLRDRRAIWLPPLEVWLRLLLGDGLWLLLLLAGASGLWLAPTNALAHASFGARLLSSTRDPRWIFVPWALYTLLTALLFHVELRYRLPLYPVLLPYAAWAICRIADCRLQIADWGKIKSTFVLAILTCLALIFLTLLHRPYVGESWMLARKHISLWQADRALERGDAVGAAADAGSALMLDADSALARVALARAALARGDRAAALASTDAAISALRAHPQPHLLRGAILREQGDLAAARAEFGFEKDSLQDLQSWSWATFAPFSTLPAAVDVGQGLDLGDVRGFWLADPAGFRWSRADSEVLLSLPQTAGAQLDISLNGTRPSAAPPPQVTLLASGTEIGRITPGPGWQSYSFALPAALIPANRQLVLTIRSDTFRPRDFDRASPDNRALGVMVGRLEIKTP